VLRCLGTGLESFGPRDRDFGSRMIRKGQDSKGARVSLVLVQQGTNKAGAAGVARPSKQHVPEHAQGQREIYRDA